MTDTLGDRMKQYEHCLQTTFPNKSHVIIRIDGRAFHTLTRGMEKPYDLKFIEAMKLTAWHLAQELQNVKGVYVQSDEISIYMCDDKTIETQPWFGNNIQKIVSISASIATQKFCEITGHIANFDSRAFILPNVDEVANYFLWRHRDWTRNSLSMLCRSFYSDREMKGVGREDQHKMLLQKGVTWEELIPTLKYGTFIQTTWQDTSRQLSHPWNFEQFKALIEGYNLYD